MYSTDVQAYLGDDWDISQLRELLVAVCCNESRLVRQNDSGPRLLTETCLYPIALMIRTRDFGSCNTLDLEELILTMRKPYWQSWESMPGGPSKQILLQVCSPPAISRFMLVGILQDSHNTLWRLPASMPLLSMSGCLDCKSCNSLN